MTLSTFRMFAAVLAVGTLAAPAQAKPSRKAAKDAPVTQPTVAPEEKPVAAAAPSKAYVAPPSAPSATAGLSARLENTGSESILLGAALDGFGESSRMTGEQWINNFRADESFNYSTTSLGATLYALFRPMGKFRFGPGVRFLGNYGGKDFTFGYLIELHAQADFSLRAFELVDVIFAGRLGASVLFPGEDFSNEIRRLQAQGADVWSVPRLGWEAGLSFGVRRKVAGALAARLDFSGQIGHQFFFTTDQIVDGLRFRKFWGNDIRRLGLNLGVEVAL